MSITPQIKKILDNDESDDPGSKANLVRMLDHGRPADTGKLVILPVDRGSEHGRARSFAVDPAACDPHFHLDLAIGAGRIARIPKLDSSDSLAAETGRAVTGPVADARRLGRAAIGSTICPGSESAFDRMKARQEPAEETKAGEIAIDIATATHRVRHIVRSRFNEGRIMIFSGVENADIDGLIEVGRGLAEGDANGSVTGRNAFPPPSADAATLLDTVAGIFEASA